jgi:hypothetical protein
VADSFDQAVKAKTWLMLNGYFVTLITRKRWLVMGKDKKQQVFKNNADFEAFAKSQGWEG